MDGALRQAFSPEFLGRVDQIVCFEPLGAGAMDAIAWKYLREVQARLDQMGIELQLPEELAHDLGCRCGKKAGARSLRRMVQDEVEGPLATILLKQSKKPTVIRGTYRDGVLEFTS